MSDNDPKTANVMAGIPATNFNLYHRIRFSVGDPAALIETTGESGVPQTLLILRDIEMDRARMFARADEVKCPKDYEPEGGLSGDRETATAQAVGEYLRRIGIQRVIADRTLPLIFADAIQNVGVEVFCDLEKGVRERRAKDEQEIGWLRQAQEMTEEVMRMACERVACADADKNGILTVGGEILTSEGIRSKIDVYLMKRGYGNPESIVAGGAQGGDCHEHGSGALRTGEPVIIDIFPVNRETKYNGDCTRTVVHGDVSEEIARRHEAVITAKTAAIEAIRADVSGEEVHSATASVIGEYGYSMGIEEWEKDETRAGMPHGTGHGIGLEVHEPPFLDKKGTILVTGDVLTVEPGVYCKQLGGVRIEDMVVVTRDGCENLNTLYEGLSWK